MLASQALAMSAGAPATLQGTTASTIIWLERQPMHLSRTAQSTSRFARCWLLCQLASSAGKDVVYTDTWCLPVPRYHCCPLQPSHHQPSGQTFSTRLQVTSRHQLTLHCHQNPQLYLKPPAAVPTGAASPSMAPTQLPCKATWGSMFTATATTWKMVWRRGM